MNFLMHVLIIILISAVLFILYTFINPEVRESLYFGKKKLRENQEAWDIYSKNMTDQEKDDCYIEWCEWRKHVTGNHFYWFPRKNNNPPCKRNGDNVSE